MVGGFQAPQPMKNVESSAEPLARYNHRSYGSSVHWKSLLVVVAWIPRVGALHNSKESDRCTDADILKDMDGYPFSLKSDNGAPFCCEEFMKFFFGNGIEHMKYPPQANGHVERP